MKKRLLLFSALIAAAVLTGCAIRETMQARAMLAKCGFELESVDLQLLEFAPAITFNNNSGKRFSIEQPSVVELLPLLMELKARKFSIDVKNLDFIANVKVHNPNNHDATLDKVLVDAYLDDMHLMKIEHREYDGIPAMGEATVPLHVRVPATIDLQKALNAQEITLKGKVWLRLNVSGKLGAILPFPVSIKRPVPREQIKAAIKKEQGRIVRKLSKELESKETMEKAGKMLKGLFE